MLFAACDDAPDSVVELGMIDFHDTLLPIEAPATAARGEPFVVRVATAGGGCVSLDVTDVEVRDDGAEVWPYDRRHILRSEEAGCTLELVYLQHEAEMTFETAGPKTIRVHGRRVARQVDEAIEIPITVLVE